MIETKEQYQKVFLKLAKTSIDEESRMGLWKTIEALREVARAGREWRGLRGKLIYESEIELGKALDALPDWIVEE